MKKAVKKALKPILESALAESILLKAPSVLTRAAKRLSIERCEKLFVQNGQGSRYDGAVRTALVERFGRIDREMDVRTSPTDGLFVAEALLSLERPGAIVECGCFNGGSTAKLSIVAQLTGRPFVVFDSFEGLPVADYNLHARRKSADVTWDPGQYAAPLDHVKDNIGRYGELSACTFVEGWFCDTLEAHLPANIALAFTDVDLPSSARDCLLHIWPRLTEGGLYFSHDIAFIRVLLTLTDTWQKLGDPVPIIFGAGYGMCDTSPNLGFAVKGPVAAEYIKGLMLEK